METGTVTRRGDQDEGGGEGGNPLPQDTHEQDTQDTHEQDSNDQETQGRQKRRRVGPPPPKVEPPKSRSMNIKEMLQCMAARTVQKELVNHPTKSVTKIESFSQSLSRCNGLDGPEKPKLIDNNFTGGKGYKVNMGLDDEMESKSDQNRAYKGIQKEPPVNEKCRNQNSA